MPQTKLFIVWGNNVTVSNLHLQRVIQAARANGAKLVVIDPKRIRVAEQAHLHLAINPGTDVALAFALTNELQRLGAFDTAFIEQWVSGFDAYMEKVRQMTTPEAAAICGVPEAEGKGSSTAPPALIEATSQLGPMSREMKAEEIDAFEKKYGYKPTQVKVAIDALAVFAHKDNPIKGLTFKQVDSIFSKTRKRGGEEITDWGQLGLDAIDQRLREPLGAQIRVGELR